MVSNLGKYLRKLRIDHDMNLRDVADCLGVSAAYVSAIERGKRAAPAPFIESIANHFKIKGEALEEFKKLADLSQPSIKINLIKVNEQTKEVFLFFARKLEELSPEQVQKLKKTLQG
ncbi:helix-turn-helix transcriptional regulator [Candidatus Sodalis endolongispinus]|uniref:Helix-turn-helix transcriptional regulator n=1 Tax=Candidatus Sodalis endolongispinus TaxID=2812662 RepID=A0ABS5Y7U3_9GAMM|nr:helix-turn-helix transcriptional regulator [Candidatus Sodalis endolongispinus]MBT9431048.1 helix-turn-helix transcriptional regulator [Candidatus Sodalis endolongispinus]